MAFCFPGYSESGSDLPPPPRCAATWRADVMASLPEVRTTIVIGQYAQRWHLGKAAGKSGVTQTVRSWRDYAPRVFPMPHPSWRNNAVLRRNPWIAQELIPALQSRVSELLET